MTRPALLLSLLLAPLLANTAAAQAPSADDIVEKHLAAIGGREALGKLTSRHSTGTVTLSTPAGDLPGTIETFNKAPNKTRVLIKADLTAMGAGEMTIDQRFDGTSGIAMNSMQGDTEIAGKQLENMRNGQFPTMLLRYKEAGARVELLPGEQLAGRSMVVLRLTPRTGEPIRFYLDADTYLAARTVTMASSPQGGAMEQTSDASDYRAVDGVKVAFKLVNSNPLQSSTMVIKTVEHNATLDDAMFAKK